jgi:putative heme-binding domain-containing protein
LLEKLAAVPALAEKASRLAALWGDTRATETLIAKMNDPQATAETKLKAIRAAREAGTGRAREALLRLLAAEKNDGLAIEAVRALGEIGGDTVADETLKRWPDLSPGARRAAADVLVSRKNWTRTFLAAVEKKQVAPTDISAATIRSLAQNSDASIRERAAKAIGRFRASDADKLKLIAGKRKVVLSGQPDINAGYEVARRVCFVCHKMHGEGAEVGPDLTGVGRSSLDALLANVIDPNQIIGKGYENVEVETKDGRLLNGRLVEETETRVKLLSAGPKEEVVARSDMAKLRVSEMSVMPEGLEQMPDADFRNLIWYILNPPQDKRPMTPALRRELIGEGESAAKPSTAVGAPLDANRKVALHSENY